VKNLKFSLLLLLIFSANSGALVRYVFPELSLDDSTVVVSFKTDAPVTRPNVYYDRFDNDGPYGDYLYNLYFRKDTSDTFFSFRLKNIEPGVLYRYVVTVNNERNLTIPSREKYFRVIRDKKGNLRFGLAYDVLPFVGYKGDGVVSIRWVLTREADEAFVIVYDGDRPIAQVGSVEKTKEFEYDIHELPHNKRLFYRVYSICGDDTLTSSGWFSTLKDPGHEFSFVFMGDSRSNWRWPNSVDHTNYIAVTTLNLLARILGRYEHDFVIFSGDLIGGGTTDTTQALEQYLTWLSAVWQDNRNAFYFNVVGNHDATAPNRRLPNGDYVPLEPPYSSECYWARMFVLPENGPEAPKGMAPYRENTYSFDWGDVHFVVLNDDYGYYRKNKHRRPAALTPEQWDWLINDLKANQGKWIIVAYHEPTFSPLGRQDFDSTQIDSLWRVFDRYGVTAVINGHEHIYARLDVDSTLVPGMKNVIPQFISGRAGAPKYRTNRKLAFESHVRAIDNSRHFVLVHASRDSLVFQAIDFDGKVIDRWVAKKR